MTTPAEAQEHLAAQQAVQEPPLVDPGNPLLAEGPAGLSCGLIQTPAGQRALVTVRTSSATVTVMLSKADAEKWASRIRGAASAMSGLILAGAGDAPP